MNSSAAAAWAREIDADGIAWLTFDKPGSSTNVLSRAALLELDTHLKALASTSLRGLVIRSAKSGGFIAGADVKEFVALDDVAQAEQMVRNAQTILDSIEALPCRRSPSSMATRSAAASNWRSPVDTAWASRETAFRSAFPR
jgi:3-hydroxyacyl-CoA dehydrogenase/enoyl-CoA hydratase/3-hydroxybutyryl-CoA epimerase